jgi:hypothetical protein
MKSSRREREYFSSFPKISRKFSQVTKKTRKIKTLLKIYSISKLLSNFFKILNDIFQSHHPNAAAETRTNSLLIFLLEWKFGMFFDPGIN